ncbi:hypothetical protein [Brunnivagina elsteri]|uniref:Uncharacterized protein n=1 Tax=Brunnivagina elsteri CCALA 953 TaxID=987040 RepID=A0A2A2TNV3_9CYAN|nr:hypothetical protein [Calothrix elsteri]PAX60087.1 hypothetical protein CK510_03700 [Calothrix elsteri CCALA 953]
MQVIQPLLGLSTFPLGIVKNFDLSNRLLLKQDSNFQLGFKNAIQPLGASSRVGLQTKLPGVQPLVNYSKLLLPRQDKAVIDEKVWNSENWDINEFTTFSTYELENELETDIFLSQEEVNTSSDSEFNSNIDSIENPFTTIITDLLPSNNQSNFDVHIENEGNNINNANIETNNIYATSDIRKEENILEQLPKKSKSKSKETSTTKSRTKKSSNKKSQNVVANNIQSSHNEMSGDTSVKQHLQQNQYIPAQQEISHPEKEPLNQELIAYSAENTVFQKIEESNDIDQYILELDAIAPDNHIINQSINNEPTQNNSFTVIDDLKAQESLPITESNFNIIPELLLQMTPDALESNRVKENKNVCENLNNYQKDIPQTPQKYIAENSTTQEEYKQHNIEPNTIKNQSENKPTLVIEASSANSNEIINTAYTSENSINYVPVKENINSANTENKVESEVKLLPIPKSASENKIVENQPIIIEEKNHINTHDNNLETITKDISPVANFDFVVPSITQDNLEIHQELNHPVQPINSDVENTDTNNIVTNLINYQQIESTGIQQTHLYPEVSSDDNLEIPNIQEKTEKDNNTLKLTEGNNISHDISKENLNNIANNAIESQYLEDSEQSLSIKTETSQQQTPTELSLSKLEDNSLETQAVENLPDINEVSQKNHFVNLLNKLSDNLPDHLADNLPAPTGYATGGLVAQTNISDNSAIAPSDTVPAMLTPGEFVINVRDAQKNINVLRHINTGGTLPENITISKTPSIEPIEVKDTSYIQPLTQVDNFQNSPDIISPKITNTSVSSLPSPKIKNPVIIARHPLQFNTFDNSNHSLPDENLTTKIPNNHNNYSSPSLIFRQAKTKNTATDNNYNTSLPIQWGSVEELLNGNADEFITFNFSQDHHQKSNLDDLTNLQTPQILTKRLPAIQGFADGGEVAESDIATDIEPITETIQSPTESANNSNSSNEEKSKENSPDLEILAREIYSKLRQRLEIERERYGMYSGRLPW